MNLFNTVRHAKTWYHQVYMVVEIERDDSTSFSTSIKREGRSKEVARLKSKAVKVRKEREEEDERREEGEEDKEKGGKEEEKEVKQEEHIKPEPYWAGVKLEARGDQI